MKRHLLGVHDKAEAYAFEFCNKRCAQNNNMTIHIKEIHTNGLNITECSSLK